MNWLQTVAPDSNPVTRDETKAYARIYTDREDSIVDTLIVAAVRYIEEECYRAIMPQTWELYLDEWPEDDIVFLPRPLIQKVNSIKYYDTDGDLQTLDSGLYQVDINTEPGRAKPAYGEVWPSVRSGKLSVITINYDNGWADADSVPDDIKTAIWLLVSHWFENREAVVVGTITSTLKMAVDALIANYKVRRYGY